VADLFAEARGALGELGVDQLDLPARADRPGADLEPDPEAAAAHATQ
jgi:hypothetical protein